MQRAELCGFIWRTNCLTTTHNILYTHHATQSSQVEVIYNFHLLKLFTPFSFNVFFSLCKGSRFQWAQISQNVFTNYVCSLQSPQDGDTEPVMSPQYGALDLLSYVDVEPEKACQRTRGWDNPSSVIHRAVAPARRLININVGDDARRLRRMMTTELKV